MQSRLLLHKQEELRQLEQRLERLDLMVTSKDKDALCSHRIRGDFTQQHGQLLADIEAKFCSYCKSHHVTYLVDHQIRYC